MAGGVGTALALFAVSTIVSIAISAATAPNIKGPRQKDTGIQSSDYGRPIPLVYGPTNRLTGTVIFYGGLEETKRKESGSGGSTTTYTYSCSAAFAICEAKPGATLSRVWANKKLIYEEGEYSVAESIVFYDGSASQDPDPTIESYLGVGEVPAYRHTCYVAVKNIELADFGASLPQFEFEIAADVSITPDAVVVDLATRAGVDIDVSLLDGNVGSLDGYVIDQEVTVAEALSPLSAVYYFDVAERGGTLVCVPRGMDAVATIRMADAGAVALGNTSQATIANERIPEAELPQQVAVTYRDLYRDLQPATQRAERNLGSAKENVTVDVPLTLDADQARRIAHRVLWGAICARRSAKLSVSPRWIGVLPSDVISLEMPTGAFLPFRLIKSTMGADGVLEWEAQYEDPEIYNCGVVGGETTTTTSPETTSPGVTTLVCLDIPLLRDAHDNTGFYWIVSGASAGWRGAVVWRSTDGGTDYEAISEITGGGTLGTVATALPAGPGDVWDWANTITVTLIDDDGELESRSQLSVLNGSNAAWIGPASGLGGELLQFQTATLVSAGVYELSGLLRGRRGTEWAIGNHEANEMFVLLDDSANLYRQDFGSGDLDVARLFKPVSVLTSIDNTDSQEFTNTGEGKRCLSPAQLVGRPNGSGDVAVSWHRRTRMFSGGFGSVAPLAEQDETYQLDFYSPAEEWASGDSYVIGDIRRHQSAYDYGWRYYRSKNAHTGNANNEPNQTSANWTARWIEISPLRSLSLADRSNYTYTAAMQVSDGWLPGDSLQIQCRQRSAVRGFGHPGFAVT